MNARDITRVLNAIPLPCLLIDGSDRVQAVNVHAEESLGRDLVGSHYFNALRQPAVIGAVEACAREGRIASARYVVSDAGGERQRLATCSPMAGVGDGSGILVCIEDVTLLERADVMRRDFVANASHELRNPLASLLGLVETLRGPARADAEATDRFLSRMQVEAERMERLIRDLLSLSKLENQEEAGPEGEVDLGKCVDSVLQSMETVAAGAGVRFERKFPDAPVVVPGDADQLKQVVANLVENAVKYGGEGKAVGISVGTEAGGPRTGVRAVISVRDEGAGIDAAHIPRLTERFYRVDSHRSREMGGTGLGLAIVKHIVGRHRGWLRIASEPGRGSEFRVLLPMAARGAESTA